MLTHRIINSQAGKLFATFYTLRTYLLAESSKNIFKGVTYFSVKIDLSKLIIFYMDC